MENKSWKDGWDERYQFESLRGKGSYGVVGCFIDKKTGERVAIKRMHTVTDIIDAKRLLREIMVLHYFRHPNILELKGILQKQGVNGEEIHLVTSLMDSDLNRIIRKSFQDLTDAHIQYMLYQIFKGLQFLHSGNVIHRDVKPCNILANEDCDVVLCDFGFARDAETNAEMTEYVVTRFYRAPEVMLSSQKYSTAVDLWSVGCTIYEMLAGAPLFQTKNYLELIKMIVSTLGKPKPSEISFITNERGRDFILSLPDSAPTRVSSRIARNSNAKLLDLLDKCLVFDPAKRITAEEAMRHPYFISLFEENDIKKFSGHVDFGFDSDDKKTLPELKKMINDVIDSINSYKQT